ncbi:MAG: DNA polymerase III subunit delta' [Gemmataceae bacterium]|nr:DNA polymerase III subunit delta' [Gemmata sp.]MDW8197462.1 DNA polymerase III subunit delta' [Gemmataceae bacterium]
MSWPAIRGHAAVWQLFLNAVQQNRLGQAYLLVGPEGIGKKRLAYALAQALLCPQPPALLTACNRCPACAQVAAATHPDLLVLRTPAGKQELPVAAMREFCAHLALTPVRGSRKIGIVEDADDFNDESANAFLKTLEEPPPGTLLLLVATSTDRLLPTILSRCQVVRCAALSEADLIAILEQHGIGDAPQRSRLARLAGGSAARAVALADPAFATFRRQLLEGLLSPRPDFRSLAALWTQFHDEAGKDSAAQRTRAALVLQMLIDTLRHALKLSLGATVSDLEAAELLRLKAFAERLGTARLMELLEQCLQADHYVERRVQLILVVEAIVAQFTANRVPPGP